MEWLLEIRDVSKSYGSKRVLHGINLKIRRGEIFALLGPNGAGKTTLIRVIVEGIKHEGEIIFSGRPISEMRHRIGYVPQEGLFYRELTTYANLKFYAHLHRKPIKIAKQLMERFGIPNERVEHLSGGMQRRLNIAISLIGEPELLILDEPTVGLDVESRHQVWDIIREMKREGKTLLLTTHYMDEAERLADRVAIMDEGKIIALDTIEGLKKLSGVKSAVEVHGEFETIPPEFIRRDGKIVRYSENPREEIVKIVEEVMKYGRIREVVVREPTLDDVFLKLTGRRLVE